MKRILFAIIVAVSVLPMMAQDDIAALSWGRIAYRMPSSWYASERAVQLGDTLLAYQTDRGGWPKNVKWQRRINHDEMRKIRETGIGATIDNNATTTEMRYLAKVYAATGIERFRDGFLRGLSYILEAQYDNGGWPQFYPPRPNVPYSACITYNDNAMLNVMLMLRDISDDAGYLKPLALTDSLRAVAAASFGRGIRCILDTQIRVDGKPTVWCAQHDAVTLVPAKARAYELPSYSGAESAGITLLLMELPDPSQEVIAAVHGAVAWFESHVIADSTFVRRRDAAGLSDATLVYSPGNHVWARFYDLDTGKPFVCDRDGIKRNSVELLGSERRNGYSWYVTSPDKVLKVYSKWKKKHDCIKTR
ncbi:MAG: pectate lyase [Prevotella sp.]